MRGFWSNTPGWILLRGLLLGAFAFVGLSPLLGSTTAAVVGVALAVLSMADAARVRRAAGRRGAERP